MLDLLRQHKSTLSFLGLVWHWEEARWIKMAAFAVRLLLPAVQDCSSWFPLPMGLQNMFQDVSLLDGFWNPGLWNAFWDPSRQGVLQTLGLQKAFQTPGL